MQISSRFKAAALKILAPLKQGQARRHVWVGDTGMGKTTANQALIDLAIQGNYADLVLTHDEKDPWQSQYPGGTERIDVADLQARPPTDGESYRHVVFRGFALSRSRARGCTPDSLADMAWTIIGQPQQGRVRIIVNLDELHDALVPNSQIWGGESIGPAYRKGRSVGISVFAGIQQPQLLPREALGLAETIGLFRMDGREAAYLLKLKVINQAQADIIPHLGLGDFILSSKGERHSFTKVEVINVRNERASFSGIPQDRETDEESPSDGENQRDERGTPDNKEPRGELPPVEPESVDNDGE